MDTQRDKRSNSNSAGSIVKEFCSDTSGHGLGRILPVKNRTRTVIWSFLFTVAMGLLLFQVFIQFSKYQIRPLTTLITMKSNTVRFLLV